jgi:hypothetical protein
MESADREQYVEKLRNRMFEEYSEIAMRKDLVELIMYTNGAGTAEGLRELWGILDDAVVSISRTGLGYAYCMTYLGSRELAEFMTEFYDNGYGAALVNCMRGTAALCRLMPSRAIPATPEARAYSNSQTRAVEPGWYAWANRIDGYTERFEQLSEILWNEKDFHDSSWQKAMAESLNDVFGYMYYLFETMSQFGVASESEKQELTGKQKEKALRKWLKKLFRGL